MGKQYWVNCLHTCQCRDQQKDYCIVQVLDNAALRDVENGLIIAGSNAGRADKSVSVAELMTELVA